ncbi:MAG: OsmC family protein [Rhodospirillales bacterium]
MASYSARVLWRRGSDEKMTDRRYSRAHEWIFDGGLVVPASPSPHIVPLPYSDAANVDPEEAFVAALSSCHMLFFLHYMTDEGYVVDVYDDNATGRMEKNESGRFWMSKVILDPQVSYLGEYPDPSLEAAIHHRAHEDCFIANSVRTEVVMKNS